MNKAKETKFYVISWILWNYRDISPNMIDSIKDTKMLFVEEKNEVLHYFEKIWINYEGQIIELNNENFISLSNEDKKNIISYLMSEKNIWLFEIWWTACFQDPWYILLDFLHELLKTKKIDFKIIPVPWTSALMTALSISWFNMNSFTFWWFLSENTKNEVENSKYPIAYFTKLSDSHEEFINNISFMKWDISQECFIWINLWKLYWIESKNRANLIIRWNLDTVFEELTKLWWDNENYTYEKVFIFNTKKWIDKK